MASYQQAFKDWSYLWETYGPAEDMTGAYVDQGDLAKLLRSPTKRTAATCLESQILYWFDAGPASGCDRPNSNDETLAEIAERYNRVIPT